MLLMLALTAFLILFCLLEERERSRNNRSSIGARTAFDFRSAVRIFTNQFAFWLRALWLVAFPVTFWFFADRFTFWLRCLAMSDTVWLFAYSDTFRAV